MRIENDKASLRENTKLSLKWEQWLEKRSRMQEFFYSICVWDFRGGVITVKIDELRVIAVRCLWK